MIRNDIVYAIKTYHLQHNKYPETLELSWGAAYELFKMGPDDVGPELFEEMFINGPIALEGEKLMGCKVKLVNPIDNVTIRATGAKPAAKSKGKPRRKPRPPKFEPV